MGPREQQRAGWEGSWGIWVRQKLSWTPGLPARVCPEGGAGPSLPLRPPSCIPTALHATSSSPKYLVPCLSADEPVFHGRSLTPQPTAFLSAPQLGHPLGSPQQGRAVPYAPMGGLGGGESWGAVGEQERKLSQNLYGGASEDGSPPCLTARSPLSVPRASVASTRTG